MYYLKLLERPSPFWERRWEICHGHASRAWLLRQLWNRDTLLSLDEVRRYHFPEEGLMLAHSASVCSASILATTSRDEKHDLTKTLPQLQYGHILVVSWAIVPKA